MINLLGSPEGLFKWVLSDTDDFVRAEGLQVLANLAIRVRRICFIYMFHFENPVLCDAGYKIFFANIFFTFVLPRDLFSASSQLFQLPCF
jgi:hypothetical protein